MLKRTSKFVLQVLPYLLMALAAVVLLPRVTDFTDSSRNQGRFVAAPRDRNGDDD